VVKNGSDTAVQAEVSSEFGSKSLMVQPGTSTSIAFAVRSASAAAGTIDVAAAAEDGRTAEVEASFAALTCR